MEELFYEKIIDHWRNLLQTRRFLPLLAPCQKKMSWGGRIALRRSAVLQLRVRGSGGAVGSRAFTGAFSK